MTIIATQLRCEYVERPVGIDASHPRLSWVVEAVDPAARGLRQAAYQILVASSQERLRIDGADLWDSGKVDASRANQIMYAGQKLASSQVCWWKVRLWDQEGKHSDYSEPTSWEMGLLSQEDWQAHWIGLTDGDQQLERYDEVERAVLKERAGLQPVPYLRKTTEVAQPVSKARLYVTARGLYEIYINGQRIGDAYFAPGWTDYTRHIQYQTYDVTERIQQGKNVLGAMLGPGWYSGYVGFSGEKARGYHHYGANIELLLQLVLEYEDGSCQTIDREEGLAPLDWFSGGWLSLSRPDRKRL